MPPEWVVGHDGAVLEPAERPVRLLERRADGRRRGLDGIAAPCFPVPVDRKHREAEPAVPADDAHPFDQTNGVLGTDDAPSGPDRRRGPEPPTTFGVPPIASL